MEKEGFALLYMVVSSIIYSLLLALPVMLLWNWLMPQIFSLPAISFGDAWGLVLFVRLLINNSNEDAPPLP